MIEKYLKIEQVYFFDALQYKENNFGEILQFLHTDEESIQFSIRKNTKTGIPILEGTKHHLSGNIRFILDDSNWIVKTCNNEYKTYTNEEFVKLFKEAR
jgi:hypothetical protein